MVGLLSFYQISTSSSSGWQPLRLGAGGWVHDIDVAADGTMVAQTDTYGAYIWNSTISAPGPGTSVGMWQQLCTPSSLPTGTTISDLFTIQQSVGGGQGVYSIRIAPSNTQIFYMSYMGRIFKSTNQGTTWTQTNYSFVSFNDMPPNESYGFSMGRRMVIDPINPNIVLVGTYNGVWQTTNGGSTWTSLSSSISTPTNYGCMLAYDERVSTQSASTSLVIYAASYGRGVYKTSNGGSTWSILNTTGMPTTMRRMVVDVNGTLWLIDDSGSLTAPLWTHSASTWTNISISSASVTGSPMHSVAIDPTVANAQRIVLTQQTGNIVQSTNGGSSWAGSNGGNGYPHGPSSPSTGLIATDIPYIGLVQLDTSGNQVFDSTGKLWFTEGVGVWNGNPPSNLASSWYWTSQSAGIEQLVTNIVISPTAGSPVVGCYDRAFLTASSPHVYRSTYDPIEFTSPPGGFGLDWCGSTPTFIVGARVGGLDTSLNGGTTWSTQNTLPFQGGNGHGLLAVGSTSNFMFSHFGTGNPWYTLNAGSTWTNTSSYFSTNFGFNPQGVPLVADKVDQGTFYILGNSNIYKTTDGGQTWALTASGPFTSGGTVDPTAAGIFRAVPGKSGHLFYTGGQNYNNNHPQAFPMYRSINHGSTWTVVNSLIKEPWLIGIGKQQSTSGATYPTVFYFGWYNVAGTDTPGIWASIDNCSTFQQIGAFTTYGTYDINVNWLEGDANTDGVCYLALPGSGVAYYGP